MKKGAIWSTIESYDNAERLGDVLRTVILPWHFGHLSLATCDITVEEDLLRCLAFTSRAVLKATRQFIEHNTLFRPTYEPWR